MAFKNLRKGNLALPRYLSKIPVLRGEVSWWIYRTISTYIIKRRRITLASFTYTNVCQDTCVVNKSIIVIPFPAYLCLLVVSTQTNKSTNTRSTCTEDYTSIFIIRTCTFPKRKFKISFCINMSYGIWEVSPIKIYFKEPFL